jgi:hypothetical protein
MASMRTNALAALVDAADNAGFEPQPSLGTPVHDLGVDALTTGCAAFGTQNPMVDVDPESLYI